MQSKNDAAVYRTKINVAFLSVLTTGVLSVTKVAIGILVGSVSVFSEGIHSASDLLAAVMAFFSVRRCAQPPDTDHHYGHGKFESISGAVESLLILAAAIYVALIAVARLARGAEIAHQKPALIIMAISAVANWLVSARLFRVARATHSLALEADAWHLRADAYTSIGVFSALGLLATTGMHIWDPLAALAVAAVMIRAAWKILTEAWGQLVDTALPPEEERIIKEMLEHHRPRFVSYHQLRTRRAGPYRYVDLHLVVDKDTTVEQAHALCDHLESRIRDILPNTEVFIHIEPGREDRRTRDLAAMAGDN